jgi:molybdopterin molybdotransferase
MSIDKQPSCDDPAEPQLLPVAEARQRLDAGLQSVTESECVALRASLGRVLAEDVQSAIAVPSHTNSAMDGYAICAASIPASGEAALSVLGTSWAGQPFEGAVVGKGQAVRIFTGAVLPAGADTVVIQEHVATEDNGIRIDSAVQAGRNVRAAGEDVHPGQTVLQAGIRLGAAQIGLLASLGIARVDVFRRVRVAFFSTGDELWSLDEHAGQSLPAGALFDSNRYTLWGMLEQLGVEIIDLGVVRDDPELTREAFMSAAAQADVIVTSGGISAGEADYVTRVFHEIGQVSFWKIAMRPGRPLAFGHIEDSVFFGLPGNPVAVMVTFLEFVQPAIKRCMGMRDIDSLQVKAICQSPLKKASGRVEYQRGVLGNDANGELTVTSTGKQGAGRLSSMSAANCLIVVAAEVDQVEAGDRVTVQPFYGLLQ